MRARAIAITMVLAGGCAHVLPAPTDGVPPPWPAPDATRVERSEAPRPAQPSSAPVIPELKRTDKN